MGILIAHPADRPNVCRGLAAPLILFFPFFYGFSASHAVLAFAVTFLLIGETNYIIHIHIHRPFAKAQWLNLLLDVAMGISTGFTASNWRITASLRPPRRGG